MGFKIRDDAPTALMIPAQIGGGDNNPTSERRHYDIGETITQITSDIVARVRAGDEHLCRFIEETDGTDTKVVDQVVAAGDISAEKAEEFLAAQKQALQVPSVQTPVAEPAPVVTEADVDEEQEASDAPVEAASEVAQNPFSVPTEE